MEVTCTEHLSLPIFPVLEYKPGKKSARSFSEMCTLCFVLFFFLFSRKQKTTLFVHESKASQIPHCCTSSLQQVFFETVFGNIVKSVLLSLTA